ncbi:hypothetical protein BFN03_15965 [Rhodococcus sp. WMMA185]|nr:hypothetical protein BFN03_15965 [Rhodococcus sp. WMMA185]
MLRQVPCFLQRSPYPGNPSDGFGQAKQKVGAEMAMQVFSLIAMLGALIVLIPTALRVFRKSGKVNDGSARNEDRPED